MSAFDQTTRPAERKEVDVRFIDREWPIAAKGFLPLERATVVGTSR
jgi:hypothetical protein